MSRGIQPSGQYRSHPSRNWWDPTFWKAREAVEGSEPEPYVHTPLRRVYFLLDRDAAQIKIGIAGNVEQRKSEIERTSGRTLELLGSVAGGYDLERAMHGRFDRYRVEGREWYSSEIVGELPEILREVA